MKFEWDEAKRQGNLAKHGEDFVRIVDFEIVTALVAVDDRRDYGETRLVALGLIGARVMYVAYTEREDAVRVISLRRADKKEIGVYVESL